MKQSRATSLVKSVVSTAVGFAVAFLANMAILPWFGLPISHSANLLLTTIYTAISIARGYALERAYESMGWRPRMSAFALAVLAERRRQIDGEGWTQGHDDKHAEGELALAAAAYIENTCKGCSYEVPAGDTYPQWPALGPNDGCPPRWWPWTKRWWKPTAFRRDLVKAGALILAEGERHDRNRRRKDPTPAPAAPTLPTRGRVGASGGSAP